MGSSSSSFSSGCFGVGFFLSLDCVGCVGGSICFGIALAVLLRLVVVGCIRLAWLSCDEGDGGDANIDENKLPPLKEEKWAEEGAIGW